MTSPEFTVIIPARYGSSRFPGKPLADIAGMSMIERVYRQSAASRASRVVVATDDQRIIDEVDRFGGEAIMTRVNHETGTDRLHEAAEMLALGRNDIVVNVQGDEPLIPPEAIDQVAAMVTGGFRMATLCEAITSVEDVFNPNIVKVIFDSTGAAVYFSRGPIPWSRDEFNRQGPRLPADMTWYRHLGIYGYTRAMLMNYVAWPVAPLEATERLEQLRVLANGERIAIAPSPVAIPPGIDVPEDIARTLAVLEAE